MDDFLNYFTSHQSPGDIFKFVFLIFFIMGFLVSIPVLLDLFLQRILKRKTNLVPSLTSNPPLIRVQDWLEKKGKIKDCLGELAVSPLEDSYVIFSADKKTDCYIQCCPVANDKTILHCEAVSNEYLETNKLSDENIQRLLALGWQKPDEACDNFYYDYESWGSAYLDKISEFILKSFEIYGVDQDDTILIEVNLETKE